jgi:hypothetical protein
MTRFRVLKTISTYSIWLPENRPETAENPNFWILQLGVGFGLFQEAGIFKRGNKIGGIARRIRVWPVGHILFF